jgi:hypothetical protein
VLFVAGSFPAITPRANQQLKTSVWLWKVISCQFALLARR